jgi:protein arginine N-methyltransferase 7
VGRAPESARSLSRLERLLIYHDLLLRDSIRNRAFRRALAARVVPGASVLDIGSGTGLWAIEAARRGARQVVAIEKEPLLASLIQRLAAENGVADRVRVVRGDSRRIELPRQFDLVVSETVGNLGFDEGVLELVADARARFLRPGGAVIPSAIALMAAPAHEGWRPPVRAEVFRALALHIPREPGRRRIRLLAPPRALVRVRLDAAPSRPRLDLDHLRARWRVRDAAAIDAFMVWVEMELAPGVRLSTRAGTTWSPALYGVEPLGSGPATAEFRLSLAGKESRWQVEVRTKRERVERSYSPLFAYGSLRSPWASQIRR